MDKFIRFEGFVFNSEIGELIHRDAKGNEKVSRLQPQPSKLLKLLIDNYPDIVSREEIRESIWPDVQVDFDGSIHFCIRQIRAALNDNPSNPKFIETIPRRGYRWIFEVAGREKAAPAKPSFTKNSWLFGLIGIVAISMLYFFSSINLKDINSAPQGNEKIRVGIMPLQPDDETNTFTGNEIAFQLVETLANQYRNQLEIIGPTTTNNFDLNNLRNVVNSLQIDYLINGRFSEPENKSRLLVEIIRASDGAHIWVRSYDYSIAEDSILLEIEQGVDEIFNTR